jgi:hypothetical protein
VKKFGSGQILPEDAPEPRTAQEQQPWGEQDEQELDVEVKED